jgi:hypothetical protein
MRGWDASLPDKVIGAGAAVKKKMKINEKYGADMKVY